MKVLITGANGFLGKNLALRLQEEGIEVIRFMRESSFSDLVDCLDQVEFIFHLAGVNRPNDPAEFKLGNTQLTKDLCVAIAQYRQRTGRKIPIAFASSIQASLDNPYGQSKREAEQILSCLRQTEHIPVYIYRLPNVFGKWAKPHYNSVVATFCYQLARGLDINIHNPDAQLSLVYVDDVVQQFIELLRMPLTMIDSYDALKIVPEYTVRVGELAYLIQSFKHCRSDLMLANVGTGLVRALYASYVSYLPVEEFAYPLRKHEDPRGVFVELLKTHNSGQFSYFTAHPGITRGGHYHHTKTEKFIVVKGRALFKFRHMSSQERYEVSVSADTPMVVESVPGWAHDITNIGDDDMIVMLWANEVFDREHPDTYQSAV